MTRGFLIGIVVLGAYVSSVTAAGAQQGALSVAAVPGYHIDNAVDGIRAPESRARSADHLDPVDILEHDVLHVPEDALEKRRVHCPAIDQNQQLIGGCRIEAAR